MITCRRRTSPGAGGAVGKLQLQAGQLLVGQETDFQFASLQRAGLAREAFLADQRQPAVSGGLDAELDFRQRRALQNGDMIDAGPSVAGARAVVKRGGDRVGGINELGRAGGGVLACLFQNHDFIPARRGVQQQFRRIGRRSRGGEFQGHVFPLADRHVAGVGLHTGQRDVRARLKEPLAENLRPGKINDEEKGQNGRRRAEELPGASQAVF